MNTSIRPYLHDYPFTWRNIELKISFYDQNGRSIPGKLAYITTVNGIVYYLSYDKITEGLVDMHEEPYEEALRLVTDSE